MEIPPWHWNSPRRRRNAKLREIKFVKYNGIDISSPSYQKMAWKELQKSIIYYVAILDQHNISLIRTKLLKINLVRGKGLLCQAIMKVQMKFTDLSGIYADLISFINFEFPNIGELLLTRCIIQFKKARENNDQSLSAASVIFIAHLIKRNVASNFLGLELLKLLSASLTEHSIHLCCEMLYICGNRVANKQSEKYLFPIFFRMLQYIFRNQVEQKTGIMVFKVLRQLQCKFKAKEDIDLVLRNKQVTHLISLDSAIDPQDDLNHYVRDIDYEANEKIHFQSVFKKLLKYEVEYSYDSDGDADNEEDSEEEQF